MTNTTYTNHRAEAVPSGERTVTLTVTVTYKYDGYDDRAWTEELIREHVVSCLDEGEGAVLSSSWHEDGEQVVVDIRPQSHTVDVW